MDAELQSLKKEIKLFVNSTREIVFRDQQILSPIDVGRLFDQANQYSKDYSKLVHNENYSPKSWDYTEVNFAKWLAAQRIKFAPDFYQGVKSSVCIKSNSLTECTFSITTDGCHAELTEEIGFDLINSSPSQKPKSVDGWLWAGGTLTRWIPYDVKERTGCVYILKDECDQLIATHGSFVLFAIYKNSSSASSAPKPPDILTSVNAVMKTWTPVEASKRFEYSGCVSTPPKSYHLQDHNKYIDPCDASSTSLTFEQVIKELP